MDDLISRKAVLAAYDTAHKGPPGGARRLIEEALAVDAVPVVHGLWMKSEYNGFNCCSVCHDAYVELEWLKSGKWLYCPNCGAKMDGTEEE